MKLLELCFMDCTTMPPLTQEKGKLPHTCHIWVIFLILGTPQGVSVLQMARKWHRCHNTRAWRSNSNTTKGRQPFSSCSFTFIKDQRLSDILIKNTQQRSSNAFLYLQHTLLTGDASPFHVSCSLLAAFLIYILRKRLSHFPSILSGFQL